MMRKLFFLPAVAIILWSCQNQNFNIRGTVTDPTFEGANVYLQELVDEDFVTLETAVVQNGTFTFSGKPDDVMRFVTLDEQTIPVLLEQGTTVMTIGDVVTMSGTPVNTAFSEFQIENAEIRRQMTVAFEPLRRLAEANAVTEEAQEEFRITHSGLTTELQHLTFAFGKDNINNAMGRFVIINSFNIFSSEMRDEIADLACEKLRAFSPIEMTAAHLENTRNTAVGRPFVDFTMNDPYGNEVSLSDFVGQGNYVLLSFWATWCGPCIQLLPFYNEIYAKYRDSGFNIVSVSLDNTHEAWIAGLERLEMPWAHMSDILVWRSPAIVSYAIRGIPQSVLFDREGTIIARTLPSEVLRNKLAELMP
jgi:thiol-disulfide isomerase/thioredoxin